MSSQQQEPGATEFEQRVRAALEDSAAGLDGRTRSRLTQARHAALDQLSARAARPAWRSWAPAGAAAMAVLATLLFVGQRGGDAPLGNPAGGGAIDDLELLADADALELTAELDSELDYEFYEWAAAAAEQGNGGLGT
jgi:negative regulator of sigma E activity